MKQKTVQMPGWTLLIICMCALSGGFGLAGCSVGTTNAATIVLSPSSATLGTGQQLRFTVSADGIALTAGINWSVNGVAGGNSTGGTISGSGLYTAPAAVPSSGTATIGASQQGTNGPELTATVTIVSSGTPAPSASISVSPTSIANGACAQLSWSSGNASSCSINGNDQFNGISVGTSGSTTVCPTETTSYTLDCTGTDGDASDTATLTVQTSTSTPTVSITPSTATLASNATIQFTAAIANDPSNEGLTWTSSLAPAPVVIMGTGTLTATWTAPCVTQDTTVAITATSVADVDATAVATVTVTPPASGSCNSGGNGGGGSGGGTGNCTSPPPSANPPQVSISPAIANLTGGETQNFTAALTGDDVSSQAFTWSLTSTTPDLEGTIVSTGPNTATYTAAYPAQLTAVGVVATSSEYTCDSASATVQIAPANDQ